MELLDSAVRVTWDPDGAAIVLVEIGDPMWSPVQLDGQQVVDVAPGLGRSGVKVFPRANETHRLTWTLARETAGVADAFQERVTQAMAAPRDMKDVLLSFPAGQAFRLKNAAVSAWPSDQVEHLTKETLVIQGGEMIEDGSGPPDPDIGLDGAELSLSGAFGLLDVGGDETVNLEAVATWKNGGTGADAVQATSGNRPLTIRGKGAWLPGISGNYFGAPAASYFLFSNSWSVRFDGTLPTYRPAAAMCIASKWTEAGNLRSWRVMLNTDGTVTAELSVDGAAGGSLYTYTSTTPIPLTGGEELHLLVQKDTNVIRFYLMENYEETGGAIPLGDQITSVPYGTANVASPFNLGATEAGTDDLLRGFVRRLALWHNTAGSLLSTASFVATFFNGTYTAATGDGSLGLSLPASRSGTDPLKLVNSPAPRFDGTNDSLALATPVPLNAVTGATLVWFGWVYRTTGTQDLIFCATNSTNPRAMLRLNGATIELHVRRTDSETTAVISYASPIVPFNLRCISANIDYAAGSATIYLDGSPKVTGALTSSGTTSATNSSETRVMAGQGGANPMAGDLQHGYVDRVSLSLYDHAKLISAIQTLSR